MKWWLHNKSPAHKTFWPYAGDTSVCTWIYVHVRLYITLHVAEERTLTACNSWWISGGVEVLCSVSGKTIYSFNVVNELLWRNSVCPSKSRYIWKYSSLDEAVCEEIVQSLFQLKKMRYRTWAAIDVHINNNKLTFPRSVLLIYKENKSIIKLNCGG